MTQAEAFAKLAIFKKYITTQLDIILSKTPPDPADLPMVRELVADWENAKVIEEMINFMYTP